MSYRCPTIQAQMAICQAPHALHTVEFREETVRQPAHQAIADGGELIANVIYRTLTDADFRDEVYRSYTEQKKKKLNS